MRLFNILAALFLITFFQNPTLVLGATHDVAARIKSAKPGTIVTLPAGSFTIDSIVVPAGVSVRGAGFDRTILKVTGQNGIVIRGKARSGQGTLLSDLSVRDAAGAGVLVENARDVTLSRVSVLRCLTGVMVTDSQNVRLENVVAGENRTGVLFDKCVMSAVVNCSAVNNTALSLSISQSRRCAIFNNLFANSPLGVFIAPNNQTVKSDYNFYQVDRIGQHADTPPWSVYSWRDQTGFDEHSVQLPITFVDVEKFVYKPTTPLSWSPVRAVTSGWGVRKLGDATAPKTDITGQKHRFGPVMGAYEAAFEPGRTADGKFRIAKAQGTTSVGLYNREGRLVNWLFHNLPLRAGEYSYWLPSRNWQGQPIAAGRYELRLASAALQLKAVGSGVAGNTGRSALPGDAAQFLTQQVVFDSKQRPIIVQSWTESGRNVRGMNDGLTEERWMLPGAGTHIGAASDGNGFFYSLRDFNEQYVLLKIDEDTGRPVQILPGDYNYLYPKSHFSKTVSGLAALGDRLYLADTGGNKLWSTPISDPSFREHIEVPTPSSPAADRKRDWVWLLSEKKRVLALDRGGAVRVQWESPILGAHSLAVNGERLALLSYTTGKVHLFDVSDPAQPKALPAIGTGDGPTGQIRTDRFLFKDEPIDDHKLSRVALKDNGDVAIVDVPGVKVFDATGKPKREFIGGWFNSFNVDLPNRPDGIVEVWDNSTTRTVLLDPKTQTWQQGYYGIAPGKTPLLKGSFLYQGQRYSVFDGRMPYPFQGSHPTEGFYVFARREGDKTVPLLAVTTAPRGVGQPRLLQVKTDFSTPVDTTYKPEDWTPVQGADGNPISTTFFVIAILPDGTFIEDRGFVLNRYPLQGLSAQGVPQYDWAKPQTVTLQIGDGNGQMISSHTFQETKVFRPVNRLHREFSNGGFPLLLNLADGLTNPLSGANSGSDLAVVDSKGNLQWIQPLPEINANANGPYVVDNLVYANAVETSETQVFDRDGLYLGRTGQPKGLMWGGKWLDNSWQFAPFKGNDGKHYMLYGNFNENALFWMEVAGVADIARQKLPVNVDSNKAARLAALPIPTPLKKQAPPPTRIKIEKLAKPLPVDGSKEALEQWRLAVPVPQSIITPAGASGISGPEDLSGTVRFAHEGGNLYVQNIRFDDLITMHQPKAAFFKQDTLELAINSYVAGFKFNVTRVKDEGDIILRDRFFHGNLTKLLDPAQAPRKITIHENAALFGPERKLIESLYGVDLSKSKVMVTEFKIPFIDSTYEGDTAAKPEATSGSSIYIGLMVDDNDLPGADVQNYIAWPSTYGTFSGKETGALATFE